MSHLETTDEGTEEPAAVEPTEGTPIDSEPVETTDEGTEEPAAVEPTEGTPTDS